MYQTVVWAAAALKSDISEKLPWLHLAMSWFAWVQGTRQSSWFITGYVLFLKNMVSLKLSMFLLFAHLAGKMQLNVPEKHVNVERASMATTSPAPSSDSGNHSTVNSPEYSSRPHTDSPQDDPTANPSSRFTFSDECISGNDNLHRKLSIRC